MPSGGRNSASALVSLEEQPRPQSAHGHSNVTSLSLQNQETGEQPKTLKSKEIEIELVNRKIAELEQRIRVKQAASRAQSPGQVSKALGSDFQESSQSITRSDHDDERVDLANVVAQPSDTQVTSKSDGLASASGNTQPSLTRVKANARVEQPVPHSQMMDLTDTALSLNPSARSSVAQDLAGSDSVHGSVATRHDNDHGRLKADIENDTARMDESILEMETNLRRARFEERRIEESLINIRRRKAA